MEQQMHLMAALVQKISGELRTGLQHAYENFLGFFHAIDWKRMLPLLLLLQMGLLTISRTSSLSSLSSTSRKEDLPKMVYDYYASGAEDQWTLQENRNAFSQILFRPQILIDVSKIDVSTTVVDTPRLGRREFDIKNRFALPRGLMLKNFEMLDLGKIDKAPIS